MKTVCELLTLLLFLSGIFGSEEHQKADLIVQNSKDNVELQTENTSASEWAYGGAKQGTNPAAGEPLTAFASQEQTKENNLTSAETQTLVDSNLRDREIEIVAKESSATFKEQVTPKPVTNAMLEQNSTAHESDLVNLVLKNLTNFTNSHLEVKDLLKDSLDQSVNGSSDLLLSLEKLPSTSLSPRELEQLVQEKTRNRAGNDVEKPQNFSTTGVIGSQANWLPERAGSLLNLSQNSKAPSVQEFSKPTAINAVTENQLNTSNTSQNSIASESDAKNHLPLLSISSQGQDMEHHNPGEFLIDDSAKSRIAYKISTKPLEGLAETPNSNSTESAWVQIVLKDVKSLSNKQEMEVSSTTSAPPAVDSTTKPFVSLEEYAVKQMNFILDHLLLETQEFVSQVLQASINSRFPRDNLKRYAEDLNRVLLRDSDSPFSDEVVVEPKTTNPDTIYEEIVEKLNFLKSKSSRYLQKLLPQQWISDFLNRKAELAIWLDKAAEEMHREFNLYVTEEEDRLKYQYFNETFDDISRATEIHHKLALLADLVKIVKNKKQITFMDLYMQT